SGTHCSADQRASESSTHEPQATGWPRPRLATTHSTPRQSSTTLSGRTDANASVLAQTSAAGTNDPRPATPEFSYRSATESVRIAASAAGRDRRCSAVGQLGCAARTWASRRQALELSTWAVTNEAE